MALPVREKTMRWRAVPVLALLAFLPLAPKADEDPWIPLQDKGATISRIEIHIFDVFDLNNPLESHWLARAANFVHITTRPKVVRQSLLFKEGDAVDAALIHETERLLRNLPYIRDAQITPAAAPDGSVTATVVVHDAWSLKGGLRFNSVGGQNAWRIRVDEVNLLGFGKQLLLSHEQDFERTTDEILYRDPLLFGSRWTFAGGYSKLSDGESSMVDLERPFFRLSAPWSAGADAAKQNYTEKWHDDTHVVYEFPTTDEHVSLFYHWLTRYENRTALRIGAEIYSQENRYGSLSVLRPGQLAAPDLSTRRYRGVLFYAGVSQDRFKTYTNLQNIGRTEDYDLGWEAEARAGFFPSAWGSTTDAWHFDGKFKRAFALAPDSLFLLAGDAHLRKQNDGFQDVFSETEATLYDQRFPWQTLAANVDLVWGQRLDPEDVVYLGGSDGLRGYPNYFRVGDRRWMASFEDRIVTPWNLWGLIQIGFVAYADAGAIRWYHTGDWTKTFADVGAGLRVGNLKSAFGSVVILSVAVPLVREPGVDSYQIVVGNVVRF